LCAVKLIKAHDSGLSCRAAVSSGENLIIIDAIWRGSDIEAVLGGKLIARKKRIGGTEGNTPIIGIRFFQAVTIGLGEIGTGGVPAVRKRRVIPQELMEKARILTNLHELRDIFRRTENYVAMTPILRQSKTRPARLSNNLIGLIGNA
jgi:hypothetical protein